MKADLCAFTWRLKGFAIQVESTDEVKARIGRSPDFASAYCLALMDTPKRKDMLRNMRERGTDYNPLQLAGMQLTKGREYDPFEAMR